MNTIPFRPLKFCVVSLVWWLAITSNQPALARDATPLLLQEAVELLDAVKPPDTSYQHKGGVVRWPDKAEDRAAECHTDCSGLIDALFKRAYGLNSEQFTTWMKVKRPLARNYHDAIVQQRGFQRIGNVADAMPGDLLAIAYPPGEENTGHVMLVADKPRLREPTVPRIEETQQWEVTVIDVSRSGHGPNDTRIRGDKNSDEAASEGSKKSSREGLGKGTFRIYTKDGGAIAGYCWSTTKASTFVEQSHHHLIIGRVKPEFIEALKKPTE
jgi:hypothetical protein